ncbi:MAG: dTMP kinase [Candidatus Gorgyraea atricola]|nr:dTMP kinase [Candidatus Gorgyraea atricola]
MNKRGLFITFEGPEGSGKSTHSKLLCDFLREKGHKVLYTREPGGTLISEKIRKVLLDPKNKGMDVACEMLLYIAARAQIIKEKILPALKRGEIVVCDRFTDATLVYQGYAGGIDLKTIKDINTIATKGISPEVTFLLDIEAKKGLLRSGKNKDRMERKSLLFHKKVRQGYLMIARKEPRRVRILSAIGEISETQEKIRKIVLKLIG